MTYVETLGANAKAALRSIMTAGTMKKNNALNAIADKLIERTDEIIAANKKDLEAAAANGMPVTMQDRLKLDADRIKGIADGVRTVVQAADPVGAVDSGIVRPNGMKIYKTRVPLGVIGMIFESRPNVTVDAAVLCLKSGNTVILKGGKEAINSNKCLCDIMRDAVETAGLEKNVVQLIEDTSREAANELMRLNQYLDVLIPRGGKGLIKAIVENATVPVIETGTGNCHAYIDDSADIDMAVDIVDNGKTQRPSVCNALESLLVHKDIASKVLPVLKERLDKHNVEIRGCKRTKDILGDCVVDATDEDYATEFLDYIISVKVVDSIEEAIEHIGKYSTGHSEVIITNSFKNAEKFQHEVDSAAVYVNVSTRFTDGGEFGLGAEIGISTQRLHARGPMGLNELTTVKYLISGNGQIR